MAYETIKVEIDEDVYKQVQQILVINNLTMEQAVQMFFQWGVQNAKLLKMYQPLISILIAGIAVEKPSNM